MHLLLRHAALLLILLAAGLGISHFFDVFPNGWDPTEYAWCVRDLRLPHSPYVAYILFAQGLGLIFDAPIALSLLSMGAGLGALVLLYSIRIQEGAGRMGAAIATALLASTHVFIRQSGTQEVYALQTFGLLATLFAAGRDTPRARALSGALFGTTIAVHLGALFIAPALLYRIHAQSGRTGLAVWGYWVCACLALWCVLVGFLLPFQSAETAVAEWLIYLRGIAPPFGGIELGTLPQILAGVFARLTDGATQMGHGPVATGPVGLGVLSLVAAIAGALLARRRRREVTVFWCVYPLLYLIYEVTLGAALDWGIYLPMVVVPVSVLASEFIGSAAHFAAARLRVARADAIVAALLCAVLVLPALAIVRARWGDPSADFTRHYQPNALAAIGMAASLPPQAVLLVPPSEANANAIPYYAQRTPVMFVDGQYPMLFRDRGAYTPLSPRSYLPLTNAALFSLLDQRVPVYGFEADPLHTASPRMLDPRLFTASRAGEVRIAEVIAQLPGTARQRASIGTRPVPFYRIERR